MAACLVQLIIRLRAALVLHLLNTLQPLLNFCAFKYAAPLVNKLLTLWFSCHGPVRDILLFWC